jgi:hypothetical protein
MLDENCKIQRALPEDSNSTSSFRRTSYRVKKGWHPAYDKTESLQDCCTTLSVVYACEAWTVYERVAKLLNRQFCFRKLLEITWHDEVLLLNYIFTDTF